MKFGAFMIGCLLLMGAPTPSIAQDIEENAVRFVSDPWPPWVYGGEGSTAEKGIAVDIIREIFARLPGYKPYFRELSWNNCLEAVKAGKADALILCAYNAERAGYALFTDEVVRNKAVMIARKGKLPRWTSLGDLKKYQLGILAANDYGKIFDDSAREYGYRVNDSAKSSDEALSMLKKGQFDIFLTTEIIAAEAFKSNPRNKEDFEAMVSPFSDGDIYFIAFSRKSDYAYLLPRINKIIAQIKSEGVIDKIRGEYLER